MFCYMMAAFIHPHSFRIQFRKATKKANDDDQDDRPDDGTREHDNDDDMVNQELGWCQMHGDGVGMTDDHADTW